MDGASASPIHELRPRILERRARLEAASRTLPAAYIDDLLTEIDAALRRIDEGAYGLCETCHDPIEADRLECDPLTRFCLDHLSARERRAHEQDLELATEIQSRLLPAKGIETAHWETQYRYAPAGAVGGDYCEIVAPGGGEPLFFAVGDVAGKGIAASLLMTHLSAMFRSLLSLDLPFPEVLARANRLFCESTPTTHYATLAAGRATANGIELCNAGHCRPLLLTRGGAERIEPTGVPMGLFCDGRYDVREIRMEAGDTLVLYSDGVTEAQDASGAAFEEEGLIGSLRARAGLDAGAAIDGVLEDVARFRGGEPQHDDITLLVVRRRG